MRVVELADLESVTGIKRAVSSTSERWGRHPASAAATGRERQAPLLAPVLAIQIAWGREHEQPRSSTSRTVRCANPDRCSALTSGGYPMT
jgi:hypothetical protein